MNDPTITVSIDGHRGGPYRWTVEADYGTQGFTTAGYSRTYIGARWASWRAYRRALSCP